LASIFVPLKATNSIAALNAGTIALFEDIAVGAGGSNPVYVVGANGAPRVYAISQNTPGSLGQIDALEAITSTQLSVSKTIPVGVKPVYGVMTSDDRRAFIMNEGSGTVSVVNVPSNALDTTTPVITIPQISIPGGGTTAPNPVWADLATAVAELVVLNQGDGVHPGTLSIVEIPLCSTLAQPTNPNCDLNNPVDAAGFGTIVATATVGVNPVMVSVLSDGSRAYVANAGNATTAGSISVVNLASGVVTATIPCAPDPSDTSSTPSTYAYGHPNSISATNALPTGKVYVTSGDSRYMTIIYTDTDTVQGHINLQGLGLRVLVTAP
jgi:DNA-binding beta-propeller fold protein YncE